MTEDEISQLNVILGKQIQQMIKALFGHNRPFVTILPGLPGEDNAGIIGNIDGEHLADTLQQALDHAHDAGTFYPNEGKEGVS